MKYAILLVVFAAGLAQPFQVAMNSRVNKSTESPLVAAMVAFGTGLLIATVLWASNLFGRGHIDALRVTPWWAYLTGAVGMLIVCGALTALPMTSAAFVIAVTVFGQAVGSLVLDHFGWLEVKKVPINAWRVGGAVLILGGVLMMQKR